MKEERVLGGGSPADRKAGSLSLHRKLAQVAYEVDRIPKNGIAPAAMGGFKFVEVGDAADVIRKALAEVGVSMIPSAIELVSESESETASKKLMTTVTVRTTWTITDGDSGETAIIQSMGSGADMGDKAIPKAQSSAMKYALLMGFLLSTGDDPERSDTSDRQRRESSKVHVPHEPQPATREQASSMEPVLVGPWTGTGKVDIHAGQKSYKGVSDGNIRSGPEGVFAFFSFETTDDKTIPQVRVNGAFAAALIDATAGQLHGLVATIAGDLYSVPWEKDGKRMPPFQRLELHHIEGEGGLSLPVAGQTGPGLFDPETEAELDAAL